MEAMKHQNSKFLKMLFINSHSLKLATKFLTSLIFFSAILSSSLLLPFIFNFIRFSSSNINKNYMFLLCNGILVLIVKNSGFTANIDSHQDTHLKAEIEYPQKEEKKTVIAEEKDVREIQEDQVEDKSLVTEGEEEEEKVDLVTLEGEQERDQIVVFEEEEEEEEEEAIGLLSAEELNKKCDDFIRKMREGIRIEIVMV